MFTASAKKRENIAEYLLYMWQIEDLIRAYNLDIDRIQSEIIDRHTDLDPEQRKQMRDWYESLIDMMRSEGKIKEGHLQLNTNTILELENLHRRLLNDPKFAKYATEFYNTLPLIVELRSKAGDNKKDEIETCFNALYGMLLLRLQKKEVTPETAEAFKQISRLLAHLAAYYKQDYNNELKFSDDPE
ncbi:MAG: DUF4924 family protein [Muribaculaceae bacterium]|nr:DUF4924 family protein [Muribaculaceae bacterium]